MNGLFTVAATICAASVIVALLSHFITDGGTQKLISLVMGAFLVVSLLAPVKNAVADISSSIGDIPAKQEYTATTDEVYQKQMLSVTKSNLEATLADLLEQNGVSVNRTEIILALTDENRVIISNISIYINEESAADRELITRVTEDNFSFRPQIITENNNEGTH